MIKKRMVKEISIMIGEQARMIGIGAPQDDEGRKMIILRTTSASPDLTAMSTEIPTVVKDFKVITTALMIVTTVIMRAA